MVCTSKSQADRVALIGASKMAKEGYEAVQSVMNPDVWKVIKADGSWYRVEIGKMPKVCGCAFYRSNWKFKTCKHIRFVEAEAKAQTYCNAFIGQTNPVSQIAPAAEMSYAIA